MRFEQVRGEFTTTKKFQISNGSFHCSIYTKHQLVNTCLQSVRETTESICTIGKQEKGWKASSSSERDDRNAHSGSETGKESTNKSVDKICLKFMSKTKE